MKKTIEMISSRRFNYQQNVGPYGSGNMNFMAAVKKDIAQLALSEPTIITMALDDPSKNDACRFDVGFIDTKVYPLFSQKQFRGGRYLVLEIDHSAEAISLAWMNLMTLLASSHVIFDSQRLVFERYRASLLKQHRCEICVPIKG